MIPVGFKPTTFRTFSFPISDTKYYMVEEKCDSGGIQTHDLQNFFFPDFRYKILFRWRKNVIPVGFKPTTFRTGI